MRPKTIKPIINLKYNPETGLSTPNNFNQTLIIEPRRNLLLDFDLKETWRYRELLSFLIWRDILIRYKQTFFGALWEIIKPLSIMAVLTLVMGYIARFPSDNIPYPLFYYSSVVIWSFFAQSMNSATVSVLNASTLVSRVYFPRIIIPLGIVISSLLDLVIALLVLIPMMLWYGMLPTTHIWLLPFAILLTIISALAFGLIFSALVVKYRDLQNVLPVLTQLMVFITPVFYPASIVPSKWMSLYGLNPMAGAVQAFRWSLFSSSTTPWDLLLPGSIVAVLMLVGGVAFFQRMSRSFVDWL